MKDTGEYHHQWLDLRSLCEVFAPRSHFSIEDVYYFSAYATWRPNAYRRHREYVKALQAVGVSPVLAQFKEKSRGCLNCGSRWQTHEEKETDVNIALHMLDDAYKDRFDRALIISADSDLAPPIRMVIDRFPDKQVRVLTPIGRDHSWALVNAAGGIKCAKKIIRTHIERSLLPEQIKDGTGFVIATRPKAYDPPS